MKLIPQLEINQLSVKVFLYLKHHLGYELPTICQIQTSSNMLGLGFRVYGF